MKISIITIVFNGKEYIEDAIKSVIHQYYPDIEYIIIDGGSNDGTLEIIEKYRDNIQIFISEPDKGISDAFNKGIIKSSGELVFLLNADDFLEENVISKVVNFYNPDNPEILCCKLALLNPRRHKRIWTSEPDKLNIEMTIAHPATIVPRIFYMNYGMYDLNYKIAMDYDLFLKFKQVGLPFKNIDLLLSNMRSGGVSSKMYFRAVDEVEKIKKIRLKKYSLYMSYQYKIFCYSKYYLIKILDFFNLGYFLSKYFNRG